MQELQLLEILPLSRSFTWFRSKSKSVLDRLIVSSEWISHFPSMKVSILKGGLSDHCPLFVHSHAMDWGPKPFKFQNYCLSDPKCLNIIRDSWMKKSKGTMTEKLRITKQNLKEWNHSEFGSIDANIKRLEEVISNLDNPSTQRNLDEDEVERRKIAQTNLWMWMKRKEVYWAQQSRITWLKEGDRNTKFFHAIALIKRRKNSITNIDINGTNISGPSQIKHEAINFFKKYFKKSMPTDQPSKSAIQLPFSSPSRLPNTSFFEGRN